MFGRLGIPSSAIAIALIAILSVSAGLVGANAQTGQQSPPASPRPANTDDVTPDPMAQLRARPDLQPTGLYELENGLSFNVLDAVYYDKSTAQISLIGHTDARFRGPRIPYLQHLAALLEVPDLRNSPLLNIHMTPASQQTIENFVAHTKLDEREVYELIDKVFDAADQVTPIGRVMLPELDVSPIEGFKAPGTLGVKVENASGSAVRVAQVEPDSPGEQAGLRAGDEILTVNGRSVIAPSEFDRLIRFAGAGSMITLQGRRSGEPRKFSALLASGRDGDRWKNGTRYDVEAALHREAGQADRARATYAVGVFKTFLGTPSEAAAITEFGFALGLGDAMGKLLPELGGEPAPRALIESEIGRRICRRLAQVFGPEDRAFQRTFEAELLHGKKAAIALNVALQAIEQGAQPTARKLIERAYNGNGIQLPPEALGAVFRLRPDSRPEYDGFSGDTLLARALFESDYLLKRFQFRTDFRRRFPGYQTNFEFRRKHKGLGGESRLWISVGKLDMAQSGNGSTLEFREIKMRIAIRKLSGSGSGQQDSADQPPALLQYEKMLTSLYDDFATEYPTLHEVREAAKLAAAAKWIRRQNASFRLPPEGRIRWQGPASLPGLVYVYLPPRSDPDQQPAVSVQGGARITWDGEPSNDPMVVDLRDLRFVGRPPRSGRSVIDVLGESPRNPAPRPNAWVAREKRNGRDVQVATITGLRDAVAPKTLVDDGGQALQYNTRDLDTAEAQYRQIIATTSDPVEKALALAKLASVLHMKGNNRAAIEAYNTARTLAPNLAIFELLRCQALDEDGKRAEAVQCLRGYISREPGNRSAKELLTQLETGRTTPHPNWTPPQEDQISTDFVECVDRGVQEKCAHMRPVVLRGMRPPTPPPLLDEIKVTNPRLLGMPEVDALLQQQQKARDDYRRAWTEAYYTQYEKDHGQASQEDVDKANHAAEEAKKDMEQNRQDLKKKVEAVLD